MFLLDFGSKSNRKGDEIERTTSAFSVCLMSMTEKSAWLARLHERRERNEPSDCSTNGRMTKACWIESSLHMQSFTCCIQWWSIRIENESIIACVIVRSSTCLNSIQCSNVQCMNKVYHQGPRRTYGSLGKGKKEKFSFLDNRIEQWTDDFQEEAMRWDGWWLIPSPNQGSNEHRCRQYRHCRIGHICFMSLIDGSVLSSFLSRGCGHARAHFLNLEPTLFRHLHWKLTLSSWLHRKWTPTQRLHSKALLTRRLHSKWMITVK